ncbi:hypothetical protein [Treponema sp.]|uniref:hypothetical protein n=1 Tax=Treponema sp. TaxID=166 RepID=UPI003FA30663
MNFIQSYSGSKRAITLFWICTAIFAALPAQEHNQRAAFNILSNEILGDHSFAFEGYGDDTASSSFADERTDKSNDDSPDDTDDDSENSADYSTTREDAWLSAPALVLEEEPPAAKHISIEEEEIKKPQMNQQEVSKEKPQEDQRDSLKEQQPPRLNTSKADESGTQQPVQHEIPPLSSGQQIQEEQTSVQAQAREKKRTKTAAAAMRLNRYFFRYLHTVHKGAQFSAGISGLGYTGYMQLTSPMPMPYFELSAYKFGAGLYPLAALQAVYPEKNIPTLFLGAGSLTFDSMLKAAFFTDYSTLKTGYGGIKVPRNRFIGIGTGKKTVQYGVELSGESWNGAFFASPESQRQRMRYGLQGGWHTDIQQADIKLAVRGLTAFIPEVIRVVSSESKKSKAVRSNTETADVTQRYHTLAGLQLLFAHPNISADVAGFFSYAANSAASGSVQAECDLWYRLAGLHTGVSYTGEHSVNWNGKQQHSRLTGFLQPYMKLGLFSLGGIYTIKKEKEVYQHTGGAALQLKHKIIRWQLRWDYGKALHTVKTEVLCVSTPAWFSGVQWFQKAGVGAVTELQDSMINPLVLKKYRVSAFTEFCMAEGIFIGCNGNISQSVRKTGSGAHRMIALQNPVYGGSVFFRIKRDGIGKVHIGKLEVSGKSQKPYFDVKIGYQIQGK